MQKNTADLSYLGFCSVYYASACKNGNLVLQVTKSRVTERMISLERCIAMFLW